MYTQMSLRADKNSLNIRCHSSDGSNSHRDELSKLILRHSAKFLLRGWEKEAAAVYQCIAMALPYHFLLSGERLNVFIRGGRTHMDHELNHLYCALK